MTMLRIPLLLLAVLLAPAACTESRGAAQPARDEATEPALVRVEPVQLREVQRQIETTAFLEAEHRVTVVSEVSGKIVEVTVDTGDEVGEGDVLARIDDREARTTQKQLEVQRHQAVIEKESSELAVESAGRAVARARLERDKAEAELERNRQMAQGIVSQKVLDDLRYELDAAEESLREAGFNERQARLDVQAAQNRIEELDARIEEGELLIERHTITAPLDGVVSRRMVRGGETISTATELFEVLDPDDLIAWLSRPQSELALVRNAREVRFTTDGWPGEEFTGRIDRMRPVVDDESHQVELRMRAGEEGRDRLLPGMFVRARIMVEEKREALMVPKTAVLSEGNISMVFAVRDGVAHQVTLDPGLELEAAVECRNRGDDGLLPGDVVVVSGQEHLQDQEAVEVTGT